MSALIELVESNEGASITSLFSQYRESVMDRLGHDYSADNALTMLFNDIDETMFKLDKEQKDEEVMRARLKEIQDTIVAQGGPSRVTMLMLEQTVGKEYINPLMPVNAYTERPEAEYMHYAMENMNSILNAVAGFATQGYARFIVIAFLAIIAILRFLIGKMDSDGDGDGGGSGGGSPLPQGNPRAATPSPTTTKPDGENIDWKNMTFGDILKGSEGAKVGGKLVALGKRIDEFDSFHTWYSSLKGLSTNAYVTTIGDLVDAIASDLTTVFSGNKSRVLQVVKIATNSYNKALSPSMVNDEIMLWMDVAKGNSTILPYTGAGSVLSNNPFANYPATMRFMQSSLKPTFEIVKSNMVGFNLLPGNESVHNSTDITEDAPFPPPPPLTLNVANMFKSKEGEVNGAGYLSSIKPNEIASKIDLSGIVKSISGLEREMNKKHAEAKRMLNSLDSAALELGKVNTEESAMLQTALIFTHKNTFAVKETMQSNLQRTIIILQAFSKEISKLDDITKELGKLSKLLDD